MLGIPEKILFRVRGHGRGAWVFSASDFLDLSSRETVNKALSRLASDGAIRRIARGLYDFPRYNRILREAEPPGLDSVLSGIERRDNVWIVPDNIVAANQLGLTDAVPAQLVFFTSGATRKLRIAGWTIHLKQAPSRMIDWARSPARAAIQAIEWLGEAIARSSEVIGKLRKNLSGKAKRALAAKANALPEWVADIALAVAAPV